MNSEETKTVETVEEKRARLMASANERAAARVEAKKARDLELLELREKFETEVGPEGEKFVIYEGGVGDGFIVLKLGLGVLATQYADSKQTMADRFDFVAPCVAHPSKEAFQSINSARPLVLLDLVNLLSGLYGVKAGVEEKK